MNEKDAGTEAGIELINAALNAFEGLEVKLAQTGRAVPIEGKLVRGSKHSHYRRVGFVQFYDSDIEKIVCDGNSLVITLERDANTNNYCKHIGECNQIFIGNCQGCPFTLDAAVQIIADLEIGEGVMLSDDFDDIYVERSDGYMWHVDGGEPVTLLNTIVKVQYAYAKSRSK